LGKKRERIRCERDGRTESRNVLLTSLFQLPGGEGEEEEEEGRTNFSARHRISSKKKEGGEGSKKEGRKGGEGEREKRGKVILWVDSSTLLQSLRKEMEREGEEKRGEKKGERIISSLVTPLSN